MLRVETVDSRTRVMVFDGMRTAWVIRDRKNLMIDSGYPIDRDDLFKGLAEMSLSPQDIDFVALTHIHLDHAGGAGYLARENPYLTVLVHAKGARHLIDPAKLMQSVNNAYSQRLPAIGELVPIPQVQVKTIGSGDIIDLGRTRLEVYYTPGHAKHHVIFFDPQSESVFCGDALGSKYRDYPNFVLSPPADYNKELSKTSIDLVRALKPKIINFTHCGPYVPSAHDDFFVSLKRKHDLWNQCILDIIGQDRSLDPEAVLNKFLDKLPELKNFPDQFFSFRLSVKGMLHYHKRSGEKRF